MHPDAATAQHSAWLAQASKPQLIERLKMLERALAAKDAPSPMAAPPTLQAHLQSGEAEAAGGVQQDLREVVGGTGGPYADLYHLAATALATVTAGGEVIEANLALCRRLQRPRAQIVGAPLADFFAPSCAGELARCLRACFASPDEACIEAALRPYGAQKAESVRLHARRVQGRWGPADGVQVSVVDLLQRAQLDDQLRFMLAGSELLFQTLEPKLVAERVAQLAVPFFAEAASFTTTHLPAHVSVAIAPPMLEAHRAELEFFTRQVQSSLLMRRVVESGKLLVVDCDGEDQAAELFGAEAGTPLFFATVRQVAALPVLSRRRVRGVLLLFAHKKAPARRYQPAFCDDFARRAGLAVDNASLYERKRAESHAKHNLLALVSHDLRNPLSVILLKADQLVEAAQGLEGSRGQKLVRGVHVVKQCAHRMNDLIGDLLDATSMESGNFHVAVRAELLTHIVDEALENAQAAAAAKAMVLTADIGQDLRVICDRRRTLQVLNNLLGNAIKFTQRTGSIAVRISAAGNLALISVSDNGIGIGPEAKERVFGQFWQVDQAAALGHGLGLSICRGIVEASGGKIWVESTPGNGSTFHFTLPRELVPTEAATRLPADAPGSPSVAHRRHRR